MAKRGQFIVIEGINGSGKTTQTKRLVDKLLKGGINARHTKEPTSWTPAGLQLTDIFAGKAEAPDDMTMAALFIADRMQHILDDGKGIKASLDAGRTVICDRFYLSSYVYQGQKMGLDKIMDMTMPWREMLKPDLTIFLDVPPDVCYDRIAKRKDGRPEIYSLKDLERYRDAYLEVIERRFDMLCTIDCGTKNISEIEGLIFRTLLKYFAGMF